MEIKFITRNENGVLQQNLAHWDEFKEQLFGMAKDERELAFIGQLVEDLQHEYDEKSEELEESEEEEEQCDKCEWELSECSCTKWVCEVESCKHEWKDSPFYTFEECPKCYSEHIGHL